MKLTATAQRIVTLDGVSAASGVELVGHRLYVVGDDSACLYVLDSTGFNVLQRIPIAHVAAGTSGEHIPKAVKPDFECLTRLPSADATIRLAAIGSGSKPSGSRDTFSVVTLSADATLCSSEQMSASRLFEVLRGDSEVLGSAKLNLEGATLLGETTLVLMQRGNVSGVNSILTTDAVQTEEALRDEAKPLPKYNTTYLELPQLDGWDAGASGVTTCILPALAGCMPGGEQLLFSASYEATRSEIDDGDTLGSLIGLLPSSDLMSAPSKSKLVPISALVRSPAGTVFTGKIEGVTLLRDPVLSVDGHSLHMHALAVTDPDGAASQCVVLTLELSL
jgi:hypothetical protein